MSGFTESIAETALWCRTAVSCRPVRFFAEIAPGEPAAERHVIAYLRENCCSCSDHEVVKWNDAARAAGLKREQPLQTLEH